MAGWEAVAVVAEKAPVVIGGRNVWAMPWRDTGDTVPLPHPSYPTELHLFRIYTAGPWWRSIRFAAAELSAGAWGFYVRR